jgi:type II secretory pathway component GspD/PulD (secretin)
MRTGLFILFLAAVLLSGAVAVYAVDVEEIPTAESISAQSVRGDEIISPYHVTGESLVHLVKNMVDFEKPGTSIVYNRRTAQLFVRNTPSNHELIKEILADLRSSHSYQVKIEARIITVQATDDDELGLDFLGIDAKGKYKTTQLGTDKNFNDGTYNTNVDFPNTKTTGGDNLGGQLSFAALTPEFDISAFIDSLRSRFEVNTVSAPNVIVANNQRAHIKIEKAQYYIQSLKVDSQDNASSVALDPTIGVAQSGTLLDVTPSINSNGSIALEMHPQFVSVDMGNSQKINIVNSTIVDDSLQPEVTLPVFTVQSADTTITVKNGGVAVLGGLIEESENKQHQKVPVLGDIPFVGKLLFQKNTNQEVKTHLLIFVKATIKDPRKSAL